MSGVREAEILNVWDQDIKKKKMGILDEGKEAKSP